MALLLPKEGYFLIIDDENHRWDNVFIRATMEKFTNDDFTSRYIIESCFETKEKRTMYRRIVTYAEADRVVSHYLSGGVVWGSDRNDVTQEVFG